MFNWICVYENPETSEVAGEFTTLAEALMHTPKPVAEIICNGTVLATVSGENSWVLTASGRAWVEFPKDSWPKMSDRRLSRRSRPLR
jgi:hypothetical protein